MPERIGKILCVIILCFIVKWQYVKAQSINMDQAMEIALTNHPVARNMALSSQKNALSKKQSVAIEPTRVKYWQSNTPLGDDRAWSITQDLGIIPEHIRKTKHHQYVSQIHQAEQDLTLDELKWQVKAAYLNLVYFNQRLEIMQSYDNYYEALISTAEIYLSADSVNDLTRVSAGSRYAAYQSRMYIAEEEQKRATNKLQQLLYTDYKPVATEKEISLYQIHPEKDFSRRFDAEKHKAIDDAQLQVARSAILLEKSKLFPAIQAGYINQKIAGFEHFQGWMVGMAIPLWFQPQHSRIKQSEIDLQIISNQIGYEQFANNQHIENLKSLLNEYFVQVSFSKENLMEEADLVLSDIEKQFREGTITNYAETFSKIYQAIFTKLNHLEYINQYNQTALELEYYTQ